MSVNFRQKEKRRGYGRAACDAEEGKGTEGDNNNSGAVCGFLKVNCTGCQFSQEKFRQRVRTVSLNIAVMLISRSVQQNIPRSEETTGFKGSRHVTLQILAMSPHLAMVRETSLTNWFKYHKRNK